jgi:hypothetical protein
MRYNIINMTNKISGLGTIVLSTIAGCIIGANIGSSLAAKKAFNRLDTPKEKIELAKDIKEDYRQQNIAYKVLNFSEYVKATNEYMNNI